MKIILAMVLSVDGRSTKGNLLDQSWASEEDYHHLQKLISENSLILMGGQTYNLAKSHIKPSEGKLRVVLTHDPEKYKDDYIEGQLEFAQGAVKDIVDSLEKRGLGQMLLLSGERLNKEFFEEKFIDEIFITVEPKIFGSGKKMVSESNLDIQLELLEMKKLNENGTILLHYKVKK